METTKQTIHTKGAKNLFRQINTLTIVTVILRKKKNFEILSLVLRLFVVTKMFEFKTTNRYHKN